MIISPIIPIWVMIIICVILGILAINKNKYASLRCLLIIVLLFIINLRIMISSSDVIVMSNNLDVIFVIDATISMAAEDYNGNQKRLEAVKKDCNYIMEQLAGAKFSVISFKTSSQILIPFTKDTTMATESINAIQTEYKLYARGSSMNVPKENMLQLLESSSKKENRKRIVFFISDGEITNDDKLESFSELKKYVDDGAVLGYGTITGGNMKTKDYSLSKEEEYIKDETSYPRVNAVSKIDEHNLKSIAKDLEIEYIHMDKQSNITEKLKEIKRSIISNSDEEKTKSSVDIYYLFAVPLLLILIYEFISYKRSL